MSISLVAQIHVALFDLTGAAVAAGKAEERYLQANAAAEATEEGTAAWCRANQERARAYHELDTAKLAVVRKLNNLDRFTESEIREMFNGMFNKDAE